MEGPLCVTSPGQQHHFLRVLSQRWAIALFLCGLSALNSLAHTVQTQPFTAKCLEPAHPPDKIEDPLFDLAQVIPQLTGDQPARPESLLTLLPAASKNTQPKDRKELFPKGSLALPVPRGLLS